MLDGSIIQFIANPARHPDSVIAVYENERSRNARTAYTPLNDGSWSFHLAERHLAGFFDASEVERNLSTLREYKGNEDASIRIVNIDKLRWLKR